MQFLTVRRHNYIKVYLPETHKKKTLNKLK